MSYYCAHIKKSDQKAWEDLTKKSNASGFHQSFAWASFKHTQSWETYKIGIFSSKGILVGGCIVLEFSFTNGTNFLYIPEGPVLDYIDEDALFWQWRALETALHSIVSLTPTMKTTHIRIEPRLHVVPEWFLTGFTKAPINLQPRHTQILDLSTSTEHLLNGMKQKGRYNIRLAEKKGVTVTEVPIDQVHTFYPLYKKTFTRNKFEGKDLNFFHSLTETCKSISKIFVAQAEGKNLASAIITYYGNRSDISLRSVN
jgi:peptidoglycan pentaglycine glycine transferase (the first glycine)